MPRQPHADLGLADACDIAVHRGHAGYYIFRGAPVPM
jgi:hypothetical protein